MKLHVLCDKPCAFALTTSQQSILAVFQWEDFNAKESLNGFSSNLTEMGW